MCLSAPSLHVLLLAPSTCSAPIVLSFLQHPIPPSFDLGSGNGGILWEGSGSGNGAILAMARATASAIARGALAMALAMGGLGAAFLHKERAAWRYSVAMGSQHFGQQLP